MDPSNIIPVEPGVHTVLNRAYPACYGGQAPWKQATVSLQTILQAAK